LSFEQLVKMPQDCIGVLVGKGGAVKSRVEQQCIVTISVDSETGDVHVASAGDIGSTEPFKAVNIITAIARGFSPPRAFRLLEEDTMLDVIDLREYVGKSRRALTRIRGRIIGFNGKSRRLIEELTGAYVSIYGHTAAVIGTAEEVRPAAEAVKKLASGSAHRSVYKNLQKVRTQAKIDRMKLWEE
jgi:ribosomal RNA assembly protein